ncbi:MAG TPA: hypothetical protein VGS27_12565 [Candidatus Sulfotelmatobacter sp.]|nr:hypothetical protein [Candidatus Sulfotelmatobacter sp.]
MRSNHRNEKHVRMELKYCEHCGGLWVREGGAGVYCRKCEAKVADLPVPKKRPGRLMLPKQETSQVQKYGCGIPEDVGDMEAAGGVA